MLNEDKKQFVKELGELFSRHDILGVKQLDYFCITNPRADDPTKTFTDEVVYLNETHQFSVNGDSKSQILIDLLRHIKTGAL